VILVVRKYLDYIEFIFCSQPVQTLKNVCTVEELERQLRQKQQATNNQNFFQVPFIISPQRCYCYIIIIISPLQSTAGHRPLQLLAIWLDLRLLASISSRPAQVVSPPGLRASYTTFT
jgi:hypothetical protein